MVRRRHGVAGMDTTAVGWPLGACEGERGRVGRGLGGGWTLRGGG